MGKEMRKLIIPKEAILPIWRMGIDAAREAIRPKAFSRPEIRLSLAQHQEYGDHDADGSNKRPELFSLAEPIPYGPAHIGKNAAQDYAV